MAAYNIVWSYGRSYTAGTYWSYGRLCLFESYTAPAPTTEVEALVQAALSGLGIEDSVVRAAIMRTLMSHEDVLTVLQGLGTVMMQAGISLEQLRLAFGTLSSALEASSQQAHTMASTHLRSAEVQLMEALLSAALSGQVEAHAEVISSLRQAFLDYARAALVLAARSAASAQAKVGLHGKDIERKALVSALMQAEGQETHAEAWTHLSLVSLGIASVLAYAMLSGLVKQAVAAKAELLQTIKTVLGCVSVLSQVYDEYVIGHTIVSLQGLRAFTATAECQGAALTRCLCSAIIGEVRPVHRYLIQAAVRTPYVITVRPLAYKLRAVV